MHSYTPMTLIYLWYFSINCTSAVVRLRSSWWWAERLPETCRVIITNKNWNSVHLLVLFTRNLSRCTVIQSVTMHGHTICRDVRSHNLSWCTVTQSVTMHGHTICHDARSHNPKISRATFWQLFHASFAVIFILTFSIVTTDITHLCVPEMEQVLIKVITVELPLSGLM
jgi:hypothetical protein